MTTPADRFTKLLPGDPRPTSARQLNAILESAQAYQRERFGVAPPVGALDFGIEPANLVLIQAGPSGLGQWEVSTYGAPPIDPASEPSEVRRRPMFAAGIPTASANPVAITVEPAPAYGFARAVCSGVAVCHLMVNVSTDAFAVPVVGVTGYLETSSSGGYPILTKGGAVGGSGSGSGPELVWAEILLGAFGGASSGSGSGSGSGETLTLYGVPIGPPCPVWGTVSCSGSGG